MGPTDISGTVSRTGLVEKSRSGTGRGEREAEGGTWL